MDFLPADNTGYGRKDYWDERYSKEETFDWFRTFGDIAEHIHEYVPDKKSRIVMLGCGNSTLSQDMYDDGYQEIVNIDYSPVCIAKMQALHQEARPRMTWLEGDIRDLPLESAAFDVAIDKGTMDAMMTAKGDVWDPPEQVISDCNKEIDEVLRILKPGGVFLYITFGQPHFRKRYMTRDNTTLTVTELRTQGFSYFLYVMYK
ncbi:S-adenosyl-L-methionine-dependent methyltransferase, partial [Cystobasidium minutum MCA 4210]|uniref:S-adenosyl-L-methionine-dependent methyltransferase n=1 Tax=Cystobasidium minutum MCA 4210 TaxID=1397322 RepID=UPI0034CFAD42|eukprot:jgi/Rhomi1/153255/estExt_Genewise1.C_4_t30308